MSVAVWPPLGLGGTPSICGNAQNPKMASEYWFGKLKVCWNYF
jgi:hypothetical protein